MELNKKIIYIDHGKKPQILSIWHRDKSKLNMSLEGMFGWIQDSSI